MKTASLIPNVRPLFSEHSFRVWLEAKVQSSAEGRSVSLGVKIGPEEAEILLEKNTSNRSIGTSHVAQLSRSMKLNEWRETGDTIKIATSGRLLDGQHRLKAVIASKADVLLDFAFGVAPEVFDVIDTNKVRSVGTVVGLAGYTSAIQLAASSRAVLAIDHGHNQTNSFKPTKHEIVEHIKNNPDIVESARIANNISASLGRTGSVAGLTAAAFLLRRSGGKSPAGRFFEEVRTGANVSDGSAVLALRNRFIKSDRSMYDSVTGAAMVIKAFNMWKAGRECHKLSWKSEESFPDIGE